jgi:sterol 14alpha-demethylase
MISTVPSVPGGWPYIGHALAFNRNPISFLNSARAAYGDIFRFKLLGNTVYALLSHDGNKAFFRASDEVLDSREAYRFTIPIFGRGVAYDVSPDLMEQQLKLLHPGLRDEAMQGYANIMADEVEQFANTLGDSGEIDLPTALNELTVFIAGRCLLGEEFRNKLSTEFAALYHDLEGGINLIAFVAPGAPIPKNRRRDRARRRVAAMISDLIADRRRSGGSKSDFLSVLMSARYDDNTPLSDDTITGLLLTLLFAGQHTSAVMATWLGVLLMKNFEHCARVRLEAIEVLGDTVALSKLKQMHELEYCLKETERLYPPLVMLMRRTSQPFEVGNNIVPAGNLVMVSPGVSHREPGAFRDPDLFDPYRFALPREEDRKTPYSLIGFGGGKHRCIGMAFAHQQIKVIWGVLLQKFDFKLSGDLAQPDYSTFVVGPQRPCRVRYRRRLPTEPIECAQTSLVQD